MATTSTAIATVEPVFTEPERLALAGFLAGYTPDPRGVRAGPTPARWLVPAEPPSEEDFERYRAERRAVDALEGAKLDDTFTFREKTISVRWMWQHLVEEYARHNGHADLIREVIDGSAGL